MSGSFLNAAHIPAFTALNQIRVMRLYRRALKLQMSWTPRYDVFRSQAMEIRRRFDANKDVSDPRILQRLIDATEKELYDNRHPDPYIPPTAPGGTKWERNLRAPRVIAPNLKDFQGFQTWAKDQRPYWRILLDLPRRQFLFCRHLFFPPPPPTAKEFREKSVKAHYEYQNERNTIVEQILVGRNVPEEDKPAQRRYERLIFNVKREINMWDWDAQFADIEDTGDRKALFEACFDMTTKNQRLRRLRFHREALERVKRLEKGLPPVEKREFLAKEVAIAACHGHIGDRHYAEITDNASDPESIAARDKLYQTLVVDFFIPHLEKFRGVIEKRDDFSPLEQTRWYWRPKAELLAKIDQLLAVSRLQQTIPDEQKAEWIYELWMAPKFYTEMEREPGAALEYTYWVQGKAYVPEGYVSPDEQIWAAEEQFEKEAKEAVEATKKALQDDFYKRGFVGASS